MTGKRKYQRELYKIQDFWIPTEVFFEVTESNGFQGSRPTYILLQQTTQLLWNYETERWFSCKSVDYGYNYG